MEYNLQSFGTEEPSLKSKQFSKKTIQLMIKQGIGHGKLKAILPNISTSNKRGVPTTNPKLGHQ